MGALRYLRICFSDGDWTGNARAAFIDIGEEPPAAPSEPPPAAFAGDDAALWALATAADQLVHPLNLIRHLLGERYGLVFAHDSGRLLVFESESGIPATIEVTPYRLTVGYDEEILVAFERGYVQLRPAPSLARRRAGSLTIYRDPGFDAVPERIRPQLPWIDPQLAQAADFLRVCRGEAQPPTDVREAAEDLHLVEDIVRARLQLPAGREALEAERAEHIRAWEERLRAYAGAKTGSSTAWRLMSDSPVAGSKK
jgi:predicted dehydrogenase